MNSLRNPLAHMLVGSLPAALFGLAAMVWHKPATADALQALAWLFLIFGAPAGLLAGCAFARSGRAYPR